MTDLTTKRCSKCGETKPLSEFHRNRARKDGHQYMCKPCQNDAVRTAQHRANTSAYSAALSALRDAHRPEFDALLANERAWRGLGTT